MDNALASSNRSKTISYCLIGRNLKELQKTRGTGPKCLEYVAKHLSTATYSKSQIYFLMRLFEFANEYKKLMFVTYSISDLKSKFSLVKELIKAHAED